MNKPTYEELEQSRNELAAQVERLRGCLNDCSAILDRATDGRSGILAATEKIHSIVDAAIDEPPPAALTAMKAQWQAEIIQMVRDFIKEAHPISASAVCVGYIDTCLSKVIDQIRTQEAGDDSQQTTT